MGKETSEAFIKGITRPTEIPLLEYSTVVLEPKIIYRNLGVPLLIFDPIDTSIIFMDFKEENSLLAQQHPQWITHLVYENTGHGVKHQHPEMFCKDVILFLDKVKLWQINHPAQRNTRSDN